jgi:hypothetical protein
MAADFKSWRRRAFCSARSDSCESEPHPRNPKPVTRNPEPETRNMKHETRNTKYETRNPEPETRNPKPETRNPKFRTLNVTPVAREISHPETFGACMLKEPWTEGLRVQGSGVEVRCLGFGVSSTLKTAPSTLHRRRRRDHSLLAEHQSEGAL